MKYIYSLFFVPLVFLFFSLFLAQTTRAQFSGELGAISGTLRWGNQTLPAGDIANTIKFTNQRTR